MRPRTVLLGVAALVVVVGGGAFYYVSTRLDSIVKDAIEHYGTQIAGAEVRVDEVGISARTGEGTIRGLRVANPPGFSEGHALTLGLVTVAIDATSLASSPIVVSQVLIARPAVDIELNAAGHTNLEAIRRNAESYSFSAAKGAPSPGGKKAASTGGATKSAPDAASGESRGGSETLVRIERFLVSDGTVHAELQGDTGEAYETELPELELERLGGEAGATPDQLGKEITVAFTRAVAGAVARAGAEKFIDEKIGGEAGEAAKSLLRTFIR